MINLAFRWEIVAFNAIKYIIETVKRCLALCQVTLFKINLFDFHKEEITNGS